MASPSRVPAPPDHEQTSTRSRDGRAKTPPFPLPCEYIQVPVWFYGALQTLDKTSLAVLLCISERTYSDFKNGRPKEAVIPDRVLLKRANCSEQHLRSAKLRLEKLGLISERKGTGRNRRYSIDFEAYQKIGTAEVPKRTCKKPDVPECKPRTKPEPVMVQLPGTTELVAIDEVCKAGAECTCEAHKLQYASVDSKGVNKEIPQENLRIGKPAPPHPSPPDGDAKAPAESGATTATKEPLTQETLKIAIADPVYTVWKRRPPTGELLEKTFAALVPPTQAAAKALSEAILEVKQRRKVPPIGVLPLLAKDVSEDLAIAGEQTARTDREAIAAEERFRARRQVQMREVFEANVRKWADLSPDDRAYFRELYPGECPEEG